MNPAAMNPAGAPKITMPQPVGTPVQNPGEGSTRPLDPEDAHPSKEVAEKS